MNPLATPVLTLMLFGLACYAGCLVAFVAINAVGAALDWRRRQVIRDIMRRSGVVVAAPVTREGN